MRLLDGSQDEGTVDLFNPRQGSFFLHRARQDGGSDRRQVAFDQVRSVAFLKTQGVEAEETFSPAASLLTVRLVGGETLQGVSQTPAGTRHGLFLAPADQPEIERLFLPESAILEVVSVKRLGEILTDEGMVTRDQVEKASRRQRELRDERLGDILVKRKVLTHGQLQQGLSLQDQSEQRIGEILVGQGFISDLELEEALEVQHQQRNRKLGEIMVEMGYATHKMIGIALALQYHVPFVDLPSQVLEPAATQQVPVEFARQWQVVPIGLQEGVLTVAVSDPTRSKVKEKLKVITGLTVIWSVATPQDISRALESCYS